MASTVLTSVDSATVYSDEQILADVQAAIRAVLLTGASYTLYGSHTVTRADLGRLQQMEQTYRRRVLMARGHTGRNVADFSSSSDSGNCLDDVPGDA